jgi:hypothetical protein
MAAQAVRSSDPAGRPFKQWLCAAMFGANLELAEMSSASGRVAAFVFAILIVLSAQAAVVERAAMMLA